MLILPPKRKLSILRKQQFVLVAVLIGLLVAAIFTPSTQKSSNDIVVTGAGVVTAIIAATR